MTTTPNMGLSKPALGGDAGTWDDQLNGSLDLLDVHDHAAGNGVPVPVGGLDIDDDLPIQSHGLMDVGRLVFIQQAAPTDAITLFVNTADNELYWRTFSGTNVKLTSGTTINTSLVGGIAGDYSTVGAVVAYDDSTDRYTFKQQDGTWANIASGSVRLYETGTTESVYVGLKAPAGLASTWDVTFPTAAPASTSVMLMSSTGVVSVSNTIPNAVTFSAAPTFSTGIAGAVNFAGAVTMATTLDVTGQATFTIAPTAPDYKHTTAQKLIIAGASAIDVAGSHTRANYGFVLAASANVVIYPIPIKHSDVITGYSLYLNKGSSGAATMSAALKSYLVSSGTEATEGVGSSNNTNNPGKITLVETGLSITATETKGYYLQLTPGGAGSENAYHLVVTFTRP